jgi:hypothetical protein
VWGAIGSFAGQLLSILDAKLQTILPFYILFV